ncbi:hypothetical protein AVEN_93563-1 [Araneus ventricosus]|uniref:Uncharacterized protein n=1 Tax=Araneus ventricosus TaxID=182803 RepID=A0A4Y2APZ4_ARAVE|nr:hypothetical protein AVEN_93563-1 [Araneus ventricosus]
MTRTTPEMAPSSLNFRTTPVGGRLIPTYDLAGNRPNTRDIFSGSGFRAWSPPVPKPRPCHWVTAASVAFREVDQFEDWQERWECFIAVQGDYFKGESVST